MKRFAKLLAAGALAASFAACSNDLAALLDGATGSSGALDSVIQHSRPDPGRHDGGSGRDTTENSGRDSTEVRHGTDAGLDSTRTHHDRGVQDTSRAEHDGVADTTNHGGDGGRHRGRH